ncbi:response regulator containing a CheY-like receiver domain and an HTH DNA-binding domain [Sanguibacter keddieii DSM 10542]|uniref:Response regulator containing a CheY-like receiver domain and an HTH DNA-binding domain n=1 Tax=Sanguibacter keddieii (strain ATCC 51767 / DSM 10542 / NCFB 3025 / ST-74) TaxID=446469 RepID=D1BGQ0_SANKS|nr:response regulator transcription factor [Sanguibacter keddieii]ACZ21627.1 response regulator containing a CheY-like receiver domain and an HTH DNA-binding domain [Sanguibacter keddieii DSM 10542]
MIRVLLADDHAAVRAGLRFLLESAADLQVVAEVGDGASAVERARALRPDVVLMDVRMPGTDGITATAAITAEGLAEVLVLTTFDLDDYVTGALGAGAAGYLLKSAEPHELLDAVRRVADGDGVLAPEVTRRVIRALAAAAPASTTPPASTPPSEPEPAKVTRVAGLTPRERDVLAALGRGLTNQQIATELFVSAATAKTHVSRVLMKLGVTSRVQAALVARDAGEHLRGSSGA